MRWWLLITEVGLLVVLLVMPPAVRGAVAQEDEPAAPSVPRVAARVTVTWVDSRVSVALAIVQDLYYLNASLVHGSPIPYEVGTYSTRQEQGVDRIATLRSGPGLFYVAVVFDGQTDAAADIAEFDATIEYLGPGQVAAGAEAYEGTVIAPDMDGEASYVVVTRLDLKDPADYSPVTTLEPEASPPGDEEEGSTTSSVPGESDETGAPTELGETTSETGSVFGLPPWLDPSLGAPPVDILDLVATGEGGSTSAARNFLLVVLALVPLVGVGMAVALALSARRRHRDFGERHREGFGLAPWQEQGVDVALRSLSDPEADATPGQIRAFAYTAVQHTVLAERDPDGRPTGSDLPPHERGRDPVHATRLIDVVDSHHRAIGRIQPGNLYLARVVSGPWTLVQGEDGVTGWVRTEQLTSGPPPSPSYPRGPVPVTSTGPLRYVRTDAGLRLDRRSPGGGYELVREPLPPGDYLLGPSQRGNIPVYDHHYRLLGYLDEAQVLQHTTPVPSQAPPAPSPPTP